MKERGKTIKLRMVGCDRPTPVPLSSKEALKEAITDFVIHDMSGAINSYSRKIKHRKYEPINLRIEINGTMTSIVIELPALLIKYASLIKSQNESSMGIE